MGVGPAGHGEQPGPFLIGLVRLAEVPARVQHADRGVQRATDQRRVAGQPGGGECVVGQGRVRHGKTPQEPWLRIDTDERVVDARCTCNFYQQNRLRKGPCEHILALRLLHARRLRASPALVGVSGGYALA